MDFFFHMQSVWTAQGLAGKNVKFNFIKKVNN